MAASDPREAWEALAAQALRHGTWSVLRHVDRAFYTAYYRELVTVVPEVTDGFIRPLEGPGLGMELLLHKARHEDDAVR
jgi:L-alanine-DL-glutamate epimerase-like enolase superfamily enzyme